MPSVDQQRRATRQCEKHHGRHDVGREIEIETDGDQEAQAMDALLALLADKFGEGE
jgi:hypothetical protein